MGNSSMKNIIDDIIKGAEQNTFGRRVVIQTDLDKNASELIQKIAAGSPKNPVTPRGAELAKQYAPKITSEAKKRGGPFTFNMAKYPDAETYAAHQAKHHSEWDARLEGQSDRGNRQFSKYYPGKKEGSWTPLDLAKFAGAIQALGEQGYSVKEAAEYLGLTVDALQDIVSLVR